ncbi:MAG TPA: coenzyme F420-0:L-glutamate ligase [Nocardioidaceae bacterium]|nr:coenzyme F420-0:L-glutamate ligase [Nocardioidaceae bacterium]
MPAAAGQVTLLPVRGLGQVVAGDDLAAALCAAADLRDGDVLVVTSKVVSKADGLVRRTDKASAVVAETDRVLARRGGTAVVRNLQGLVMAGAGVDASNTEPGTVVLLPRDPDGSARRLREAVSELSGCNVAVVVSDTCGRAWRTGQVDIAVGAAGLEVVHDYVGRVDGYGNPLTVTVAAVADELASAADLVKGKLAGCPAAVVRGLDPLVLPAGLHGPGAQAMIRDEADDLFGYGARDAVAHALRADPEDLRGFGGPCTAEELVTALGAPEGGSCAAVPDGSAVEVALPAVTDLESAHRAGLLEGRLTAAAFACGWVRDPERPDPELPGTIRFRPGLSLD